MKWTCKDGRVLDIKDMETDHLRNAINMLRRKGYISMADFRAYLHIPWGNMGEYAELAAEQEIMASKPTTALDLMEEELGRRNDGLCTTTVG